MSAMPDQPPSMTLLCEACRGTGQDRTELEVESCSRCDGAGRLDEVVCDLCGGSGCPTCRDRGKRIDVPCPRCKGQGQREYHPICETCGGYGERIPYEYYLNDTTP